MTADPALLSTAPELSALFDTVAGVSRLGLDTESNSMHAYHERLCLLQLAWGSADAPSRVAVDPIAVAPDGAIAGPLAPLVRWWSDPSHLVVAHGAQYDIAIFRRDLAAAPARLFDTQVAAELLGIERTGYGSLVERFTGLTLPKGHQQHDWGRRPIDPTALRYAYDDVQHLFTIADQLEALVTEADLHDEVAIACQAVLETAPHAPRPPAETFWRLALKGGRSPSRAFLARLTILVDWREALAEGLDYPPGRVINNARLLELAQRPPSDRQGWQKRLSRKVTDAQLGALLLALETDLDAVAIPLRPDAGEPPEPDVRDREKALKRWREQEAKARGVGAQAILPTSTLHWLARHGVADLEAAPQLGQARLRRYADALRKLA